MPIKEDFASSFGKGRISGFLSIFFGVASFGAVLCFLFPCRQAGGNERSDAGHPIFFS